MPADVLAHSSRGFYVVAPGEGGRVVLAPGRRREGGREREKSRGISGQMPGLVVVQLKMYR